MTKIYIARTVTYIFDENRC